MPTSTINLDQYTERAKPLILSLPHFQDRNLANAWLKRLVEDVTLSKVLKQKYLKLFIDILEGGKLDGPFLASPSRIQLQEEETSSLEEKNAGDLQGRTRSEERIEKKRSDLEVVENNLETENSGLGSDKTDFKPIDTVEPQEGASTSKATKISKKRKRENQRKRVMFRVSPVAKEDLSDYRISLEQ